MSSLSRHLREPGGHGRLDFHPECPVCRDERLAGAMPADAVISLRAEALLAAGVLAWCSVAPASVLAAGGDQEIVGTADPATSSDSLADPDAGASAPDDLPHDSSAVEPPGDDEHGPVESDVVTLGDGSAGASDGPAASPPTGSPPTATATPESKPLTEAAPEVSEPAGAAPVAAAVPSQSPATASSPAPATPSAGVISPDPSSAADGATAGSRDGNERAPARKRVVRRLGHTHRHAPNVAVRSASAPVAAVAAPQPSTTTVAYVAQQVPAPVVVRHAGKPARPGDRVHVVFAGESLWSIAQDVLGAKASVGETAREVDRLWALNRERIGTGDPDLLPIGPRLVLR
jgi:hypothetical protein